MNRLKKGLLIAALFVAGCASGNREGRGAITVLVHPDPIVAVSLDDGRWAFPFVLEIRETGGVGVTIKRVSISVQLNGVRIYQQALTSEDLENMGYPTHLAPGGIFRYQFEEQRRLPSADMINRIDAELEISGRDDRGNVVETARRLRLSSER